MKILIAFLILLSISQANGKCSMEAKEIIDKLLSTQSAINEKEVQTLYLIDLKSKFKEQRSLVRYAASNGGEKKSLIVFNSPAKIRGTALLSLNNNKNKDQWVYFPKIGLPKRIASGSKKNKFMGTDFTYADLDGEIKEDNVYRCLEEFKCQKKKKTCFKVEAKPLNDDIKRKTGYSKRILHIDKNNFVTYEILYFNYANTHIKTANYQQWKKYNNIMRPTLASMESLKKHKTFVKITERDIKTPIAPTIFTTRYLSKKMHMK